MIGTTRSEGRAAIAAFFANWSAASTSTARIAMVTPAAAARRGGRLRKESAYRPIADTGVEPEDVAVVSRSRS